MSHQIFVHKPSGIAQNDPFKEEKDPDVWDPPTPKIENKKKNTKWGAGGRGQGAKNRNQPPRGNPLGHYGAVDKPAAPRKTDQG